MFKFKYFRWTLLLLLFLFVILSSLNVGVAEFYSRSIYPSLSYALSALSSVVPFSLDEVGIFLMILSVVVFPFVWRIRRKLKWRIILIREAEMLLWIYVWFYIGWGINYYRESFFTRAGVSPAKYDEHRFKDFLYSYTDSLNRYCCNIDTVSAEHVHEEIKLSYKKVPDIYGLTTPRSFQHPKTLLFNSIYSGSGVLGFMGPFFAESHINMQITPLEYPFTYAHELSHLLGISSEAEANLWAYQTCLLSSDAEIKYSGYFGLFPYVLMNTRGLLNEEDYKNWISGVRPEVIKQYKEKREHWSSLYSPLLGEIQSAMYEFYLKGNRISSGQKNYAEVIGLLLSLPDEGIKMLAEN